MAKTVTTFEKAVKATLDKIVVALNAPNSEVSAGLLTGSGGSLLLNSLYTRHGFGNHSSTARQGQTLQELYGLTMMSEVKSLCDGRAGVNWLLTYLLNQNLLELDDPAFRDAEQQYLERCALNFLDIPNYDFLHGGLGIAYLLLDQASFDQKFFQIFFKTLSSHLEIADTGAYFPAYDFATGKLKKSCVNLGLAHGIPALMKYCLACARRFPTETEYLSVLKQLAAFIITTLERTGKTVSYFSSEISTCELSSTYSRLAWCNGDLSAAYILLQTANFLNDQSLKNLSLEILLQTTKRKAIIETSVVDGSICHGSAGVAHLYNKIWKLTSNPQFLTARDFWIEQTLKFSIHEDGIGGFKKYDPIQKKYLNDSSLITGASGIGLVLLSFLTDDFSWDYCLMMND